MLFFRYSTIRNQGGVHVPDGATMSMRYPELSRIYYEKVQAILAKKGNWSDFNSHHQLWSQIKKQETLGFNPLLDGSIDLEEPNPNDYPLIDPPIENEPPS
jgi:hypothetical protein